MTKMTDFFKKHVWFLALIFLFLVLRLPAINQIYHQDEHRWIMQADPVFDETSPHPPLAKYFFRLVGLMIDFDAVRWGPLFFALGTLFILYFTSLELTKNKKAAFLSVGLFSVNIYSIIASLQIDVDGAILPFFVLLGYLSYLNLLKNGQKKYLWLIIFVLSIVGGFLSKLSFIIFLPAIAIDYAVRHFENLKLKKTWVSPLKWSTFFLSIAVLFYFIYSKEFGGAIIEYAKNFRIFNFESRKYFDLVFKIIKSLVWLSPLIFIPVIYGLFNRQIFRKYLFCFAYLLLSSLFYLVIFDFSNLTIERYLMFAVVPGILISGEVIYNWLSKPKINKSYLFLFALFFIAFSGLLLLPHDVLPLNPKEQYVEYVKNLRFDFLIPFSGGSGPIGFYFSALFILLTWILSAAFLLGIIINKKNKLTWAWVFLIFGVGYNLLFFIEYSRGYFYGSPAKIARETVNYILSDNEIDKVITYYDIGAYELKMGNKYSSRFYTAPTRDYTKKITEYRGHYMIVDFPAIDKNGRYWPLISRCSLLKEFEDKKIKSYVFDCGSFSD